MKIVGLMWPPIVPLSWRPLSSRSPGGRLMGAPLLVITEAVPWVASDWTSARITAGLPVVSSATSTPLPVSFTAAATSASSWPAVSIVAVAHREAAEAGVVVGVADADGLDLDEDLVIARVV